MNDKNKITIGTIHLLVWGVLFSMPFILSSSYETPEFGRTFQRTWIPLFLYAIIFYINYLYLVEKFFLNKKIFYYVGINIALIVLLIGAKEFLLMNLFAPEDFPPHKGRKPSPKRLFIYWDTLSLIIPIVFAVVLKVSERWFKVEAEKKEMEKSKLQSELKHLKYQLQPHFFFNSLNNIYSLVDLSPEKAKETIHSLGKLMRYLLYESNTEKIELRREVEFLENYIELMRLRSSENVKVEKQFSEIPPQLKVAPLLFVSLIENAFKHGVSSTEQSDIYFSLSVEENKINFLSKNKSFPKTQKDRSGSGIGLENLRKRLELLYIDSHKLKIEEKEGLFIVELTIEINKP